MARPKEPVLQQRFDKLCERASRMDMVVGITVQPPSGEVKGGNSSKLDAVIVYPKGGSPRDPEQRVCAVYVLDRSLDAVATVALEELHKVA